MLLVFVLQDVGRAQWQREPTRRFSSGWALVQEGSACATELSDALRDCSDIIDHIPLQDQGLNFWQLSALTFLLTAVCETSHASKNLRDKFHQEVLRQSLYLLINFKRSEGFFSD